MATRIGPRMAQVVHFVTHNPGCSMLAAAEAVGPHGSRCYGYRTVHRTIRAGLVQDAHGARRGWTVLYPVSA